MKSAFFLLILGLTVGSARAAVSSGDASFAASAQQSALGQYALAAVARSKAAAPTTKWLASKVADDASEATAFLRAYASKHHIALDNKLGLRASVQYGNILADSGRALDQDFASAIYIDANMALSNYQDEASHGSDRELRAFAKRQVSQLEQFAAVAEKLKGHS